MKRLILFALLLLGLPLFLYGSFRVYAHYARRRAVAERVARFTEQAALYKNQLHDGDLIFHTSQSAQSKAIQLATHSPYSHCGILYQHDGEWQVLEAVQPVKLTPLANWVARGQAGHFVTKRLRDADAAPTPAGLGTLQQLRDFDLSHPAVQAKMRERYGDKLPLNETVISPASIFNSPELVTVLSL